MICQKSYWQNILLISINQDLWFYYYIQKIEHKHFKDVIDYFDDGDAFVLNDTKVFPARLMGNKEKTGARMKFFY